MKTNKFLFGAAFACALGLTACDQAVENSDVAEVQHLTEFEVEAGEAVKFFRFGDGIVVGVELEDGAASRAIPMIEQQEATPLELFTTLGLGDDVPDALVDNHDELVDLGRATAQPRDLELSFRGTSVWNSTACSSVTNWNNYWASSYSSYDRDVHATVSSGEINAGGVDDNGTSYVRLGMCHYYAPGTQTAHFLMKARRIGTNSWSSSPISLGEGKQARYYYYGSTRYEWSSESNAAYNHAGDGLRGVGWAQRTP